MRNSLENIGFMMVIGLLLIGMRTFASDIILDGQYDDWDDKPFVTDPAGDATDIEDFVKIAWYPNGDDQRLYIYFERFGGARYTRTWYPYMDIVIGESIYRVDLKINPRNKRVKVWLYDDFGSLLNYSTGKWGDLYEAEFFLPLDILIDAGRSGYSMDLHVYSSSDVAPDSGVITISTISTYSTLTFVTALLLIGLWYIKKKVGKENVVPPPNVGINPNTATLSKT